MNCPRCRRSLDEITVRETKIDVCQSGCGGIWFDNFELQRFDEPDEAADQLLSGIEVDLNLVVDRGAKIACPRCPETTLLRRPFAKEVPVAIDECPSCAGIWLDYGELFQIREAERHEEAVARQGRGEATALLRRFLAVNHHQ